MQVLNKQILVETDELLGYPDDSSREVLFRKMGKIKALQELQNLESLLEGEETDE